MFQDLDKTLENILHDQDSVPPVPKELHNADVSFETPDKNYSPTKPTINLFLYEVKENRELRDPVPIVEKLGDRFIRRQPPLRLTCDYIVTAWSNKVGDKKIAEEHQLLGQALSWLSRFPTIPNKYLQAASLKNQPFPPPTMVAQMDGNKSANEFWFALGSPPRASFHLAVTIAIDLNLTEEGSLVTTRLTEINDETLVQIGGRVLDPAKQGIAQALIDVVDAGLRTTSDLDGRYTFGRIPAGTHTFHIVAVGFEPKTQPVVVPGLPEDYEITLTEL